LESPAIDRWVRTDAAGNPRAVGFDAKRHSAEATPAPDLGWLTPKPPRPIARPAAAEPRGAASVAAEAPQEPADEGTRPIRFPSIDTRAALKPGARTIIRVGLLLERAAATQGGPVDVRGLAPDWRTVNLKVTLSSPGIDFDADGEGALTIERNRLGVPALILGTVRADLEEGDVVEVSACFQQGARFCGSAQRSFVVGEEPAASPEPGTGGTQGMHVDWDATQPDVTVYIERLDKAKANVLRWRVVPRERFDGLPSQLRAEVDLGEAPADTAFRLFSKFPALVRGKHRESIDAFGDQLWELTPVMFRDAYWALVDHYRRVLTIQFVSDDPHVPWELMRPSTEDETTVHQPLALQQIVARWIEQYDGDMRNSVPGGRLVSIEPKYKSARLQLSANPAETEERMKALGADSVDGTRDAFLGLLRNPKPDPPVALLHFTGHGVFDATIASASEIKLEGGDSLSALEVKSKDVQLGRACGSLVFFNACEVGATGSVFGEVGGWADAFLDRKFRAFIAPLWAVDESDARTVAADLLERIYAKRAPIGAALREIRTAYADKSPTFFSYLYYGDVTARLSAG
jgi:hypothetical protein